jgi:hypothetical protein
MHRSSTLLAGGTLFLGTRALAISKPIHLFPRCRATRFSFMDVSFANRTAHQRKGTTFRLVYGMWFRMEKHSGRANVSISEAGVELSTFGN